MSYPELFALVGGQVPDLRGLFLRGHGGNSAGLGEQQGDAIRNVHGTFGQHGSASASGAFYRSTGCREDIRSMNGRGMVLPLIYRGLSLPQKRTGR